MYAFRVYGFATLVVCSLYALPTQAEAERKTLTLDARGLQSLQIEADAGFLHIQGVAGTDTIEVTADIIAPNDRYRLTLEKTGNTATLISDLEGDWRPRRSYIDLTVKVPDRMILDIDDDSGEITLSDMRAAAAIDDDSGEITVKNHRGKLSVDDDSGEINIQTVEGDVTIEDDSGEIYVADVTGNVTIRDDSGDIRVNNVSGHVSIHDGSGPIAVANVKQGLTIHESGSGGLSTAAIEGGVDIRK